LLLLLIIIFMWEIYHYITERNHVSMVYNFASILYLKYMVHVMINVLYSYITYLRSTYAVLSVAVGVVPQLLAFRVCCSDIF
jgi:hypothetical protein